MKDGMSMLLASVGKDDSYRKMLDDLCREFKDGGKSPMDMYRRVVLGVISALEKMNALEDSVELNVECLAMLEDIAIYGRTVYPWQLVKLLLLVVWSNLFDEVYDEEVAVEANRCDKEEYLEEKTALLSLLIQLDSPVITLQRVTEIPLKQPYKRSWKLFHAYRRLLSVGTVTSEKCVPPKFDGMDEALERAEQKLELWEKAIVKDTQEIWDCDLCLEDPEYSSSEELGSVKRSLDEIS